MKLEQIIEKKLGKFPVGAWVPYYKEQFSPAWLEKIRACGINFIPTKTPSPAELDAVASAGLKSLVNDDRVTYASVKDMTKIKDWLAEYRDREDVFGLFVWDEPSPLMMKICGAINGEVQRVAPNLFGYINLHPTYSDRETQRDGLTYEEYLEHFVRCASPKVISFDHYPFLENKITEDNFYNLQAIRDCCNRHGLEFWSFIQTCRFLENVTPTPEQVFWQAFTNLAYGAKGLLYFTYATVTHDPATGFGPAMADTDGTLTPRYYAAQRVNRYLEEVGNTLLSLRHCGVKFYGYRCKDTAGAFAGLKDVAGGAALVGCFERENERYLLPVNLSEKESADLRLSFEDGRALSLSLGAGEGRLIKV